MYPEMIEASKAEGDKVAQRSFTYANEVEKVHARLYHQSLEDLESSKESYPYFVCPVCGLTAEREPPETCPVCGASGKVFKRID
jgi:rubrerythrin